MSDHDDIKNALRDLDKKIGEFKKILEQGKFFVKHKVWDVISGLQKNIKVQEGRCDKQQGRNVSQQKIIDEYRRTTNNLSERLNSAEELNSSRKRKRDIGDIDGGDDKKASDGRYWSRKEGSIKLKHPINGEDLGDPQGFINKQSKDRKQLTDQIAKYKQMNNENQEYIKRLKRINAGQERAIDHLHYLERENRKLKEEVQKRKAAVDEEFENKRLKMEQRSDVQTEMMQSDLIDAKQSRTESMEVLKSRYLVHVHSMYSYYIDLETEVRTLRDEVEALQSKLRVQKETSSHYKESCQEWKNENERLRMERDRSKVDNQVLRNELSVSELNSKKLAEKLEEVKSVNDSLMNAEREKLEQMYTELAAERQKNMELQSVNAKLEKSNKELEERAEFNWGIVQSLQEENNELHLQRNMKWGITHQSVISPGFQFPDSSTKSPATNQ